MRKLSVFSLFALVIIWAMSSTSLCAQEWVEFNPGYGPGTEPAINLITSTQQEITFEVEIPGFWNDTTTQAGNVFNQLKMPGYPSLGDSGKPALPVINKLIAVPSDANVSVNVHSLGQTSLQGYHVFPAQNRYTSSPDSVFVYDTAFYNTDQFSPVDTAVLSNPMIMRDYRVVNVKINPVRYNPVTDEVIILDKVEVHCNYFGTSTVNVKTHFRDTISPQDMRMYNELIINPGIQNFVVSNNVPERLLIIADRAWETLYDVDLSYFAYWKELKGIQVENAWVELNPDEPDEVARDEDAIYTYIQDYYYDHYSANVNVLLVGDPDFWGNDPTYVPQATYDCWSALWSDHKYGCVEGDPETDFTPEVTIGRLSPAQENLQSDHDMIEMMIYRGIDYENTPPLNGEDWLKDHTLISWQNYDPAKLTNYEIEDILNEYDLEYDHLIGAYSDNDDLKYEIESGCATLNYLGHGNTTDWESWSSVHYPPNTESWTISNINSLTNSDFLPITHSHSCWSVDPVNSEMSLGEAFMMAPNGGAVGVYGHNNWLAVDVTTVSAPRLYYAMFPEESWEEPYYKAGYMQNYTDNYYLDYFGQDYYSRLAAASGLWLGDPTLEIWTDTPSDLYTDIDYEQNKVQILDDNDEPKEGIKVIFNDQSNYEVVLTDANGWAESSFDIVPGTTISSTSHNYYTAYTQEVDENTTWTEAPFMRSNMIVEPGVTLTISSDITLPKYAKIVVEENASLVINDNVTITGSNYESGIEVYGNIQWGQNVSFACLLSFGRDFSVASNETLNFNAGALEVKNGYTLDLGNNVTLMGNNVQDFTKLIPFGDIVFGSGNELDGNIALSADYHLVNNTLTIPATGHFTINNCDFNIDAGSQLNISDGAEFTGLGGSFYINGLIDLGDNVTMNGPAAPAYFNSIYLNNTNQVINADNLTVNRVYIVNRGSSFTLTNSSFNNCYKLNSHDGDVTLTGTSFLDTHFKSVDQNGDNTLTITNCDFDNNTTPVPNYNGIYMSGYPQFTIEDNTINGYYNGIDVFQAGDGDMNAQIVRSNHISNCTNAGIAVHNSSVKIEYNKSNGNNYGIRVFDNSNTEITGNVTPDEQEFKDNTSYEVYFSENSFPRYFKYNIIIDEDNLGNSYGDPLLYYNTSDGRHELKDVTDNCWGNNFDHTEDLYPPNLFIWDPTWCPGMPIPDPGGEMLATADSQFEAGEYEEAKASYQEVVVTYPETQAAQTALKELYRVEKYVNEDYSDLQNFYQTNDSIQADSALNDLADFLSNQCDISMQNWQTAISWFENRIQNPKTLEDSVFAIIDLGYTYMLMENQGEKAAYVGQLPEHKPKSSDQFHAKRSYLLSLLPGEKATQQPQQEGLYEKLEAGKMLQNHPNPFSGITTITYNLEKSYNVKLEILNSMGKLVRLYDLGTNPEGMHTYKLHASNFRAGIYYYALKLNGKKSDVKKMIIME